MSLHRSTLGAVLILLLVVQTGCAGQRVPPPALAPSARAALGTVAVSWIDTAPSVKVYSTHSAARGAGQGAGTGAKAGLPLLWFGRVPHVGGAVIGLAGIGVSLAGAIIGTPIGAIVGATKAPPKAAVKEVAGAFATHVAPLDVGGCLGGRIHQTLRRGTSSWSVLAPIPPGVPAGDAARYRALALQGIDTAVDLGPLTLEVSGPFGIHPDGDIILTVPVRVVRVADGAELLAHEFRWTGSGAWPPEAAGFGEAVERACADLAADVVRAIAGWVEPPRQLSEPEDRLDATPQE